jgi:hypothetical protein
MSKCRSWAALCVITAFLVFPGRSYADGIIDLIWEMSGPQLVGYLLQCRIALDGTPESCNVVGKKVSGQGARTTTRIWLSLEGGPYLSTGRNAEGVTGPNNYEAWKVAMLAFDPMLEFESVRTPRGLSLYHGLVGGSVNLLFGSGFDAFTNAALKVKPIGVAIPIGDHWRFTVEGVLRFYPTGFSADQFGKTPATLQLNRPEVVKGLAFGLRKE